MMGGRPISAAILAGGRSRRYGSDKALALVPGGHERMLERTVRVLRQVSDDVTIIAPPDRPYARFGVPVVGERPSGEGPLGGLIAALRFAQHPDCIVVACDLPFLSPRLLRWMANRPRTGEVLLPVSGRELRPQPLHAIYATSCLETASRLFDDGERSMLSLLEALNAEYLSEGELRAHDPELASFVNVNSADDWPAAQDWPVRPNDADDS